MRVNIIIAIRVLIGRLARLLLHTSGLTDLVLCSIIQLRWKGVLDLMNKDRAAWNLQRNITTFNTSRNKESIFNGFLP